MSRYYQSSYHGSNDYKKYRQERLKANDSKPQTPFKNSYKEDLTSYKPSSTFINKEHLQTFGKQDKMLSYGTGLQAGRSADLGLKSKYQNYSTQQTSLNGKYLSKYESREKDYALKSNNYLMEKQTKIIPSYQQASDFKILQDQSYKNTSRQRPSSRFSKYEGVSQITAKDNFEDSVLSRGKDYGYQNAQRNTQIDRPSIKNYNYSAKVNNLYQKFQQDKVNEDRNYFTRKQTDFNKKAGQRNYLNTTQYQPRQKTPTYQSRNQLIKQRLNLNSNNQSSSISLNFKSNLKQPSQQDFQTKVPSFSSRYVSTHTTPQKSHFTPKDDKNLSQQRRKSLIEKSQMLKEKLNKLNTSSNKLKQNQQNQQDQIKPENLRNQNITSQGYTPPKKFTSYSLKQNRENQELTQRSVSKKIDFDINGRDLQTERNYDSVLKESNRNPTRNYMRSYKNENIQDPTLTKNNLSATKTLSSNQQSGDGALKKIQQLNERINSRLQSILKNYG